MKKYYITILLLIIIFVLFLDYYNNIIEGNIDVNNVRNSSTDSQENDVSNSEELFV